MRIFFIINGGRGAVSPGLVARIRRVLDEADVDYRIEISRTLEESNRLVVEAGESGFDTLWMGGGDGTINVLMNQSMPAHMTLGVVPMGTVNALARALGIPMRPEDAARFLLKAKAREMNVGCVNRERLFLCFAGVGFDAAVVHDVGGAFKRIGGRLAYLAAGAASIFSLKRIVPFNLEIELTNNGHGADPHSETDGLIVPKPDAKTLDTAPKSDSGYSFVVSNIRNYAGFNLFPDAHPCANAMEMWLFRHRRIDAMAAWSAATMLGWDRWKQYLKGDVGHYRVRGFTVSSEKPMYLQLDGEAVRLGNGTRYEFEFREAAVRVFTQT